MPIHRRIVRFYGLPLETAVLVVSVEKNSPAERAGLRDGDLIVAFNGQSIGSVHHLHKILVGDQIGVSASLTIIRHTEKLELPILPAESPEHKSSASLWLAISRATETVTLLYPMKILVIGSGGREHALAWKLRQSPHADRIFSAPGNAGTSEIVENVTIPANDLQRLVRFAKENRVDLTVVGPDDPLAAGIVDLFAAEKLRAFGPDKLAARIESSKIFAKELMRSQKIPTAEAAHVFQCQRSA